MKNIFPNVIIAKLTGLLVTIFIQKYPCVNGVYKNSKGSILTIQISAGPTGTGQSSCRTAKNGHPHYSIVQYSQNAVILIAAVRMSNPARNARKLCQQQGNAAVKKLMGVNHVILTALHDAEHSPAIGQRPFPVHLRDLDKPSAQGLDLRPIKRLRHVRSKIDLKFFPVRISDQMHQLVLDPTHMHAACDQQYLYFRHFFSLL